MSPLIWSFMAVAAFVTGFAQVLRGADLNDRHLTAHVVTGSLILGMVGAQLLTAVSGGSRAGVDLALAALWVWFAIVPWIVPDTPGVSPAGQYHDHVHHSCVLPHPDHEGRFLKGVRA